MDISNYEEESMYLLKKKRISTSNDQYSQTNYYKLSLVAFILSVIIVSLACSLNSNSFSTLDGTQYLFVVDGDFEPMHPLFETTDAVTGAYI